MIARIWHGKVPTEKTEAYVEYVRRTGLEGYSKTSGNRGAFILHRREGKVTHFLTLSFWDSIESIKKFAGEEYEKAKYYPEDASFLLELEPNVVHYTIAASTNLENFLKDAAE